MILLWLAFWQRLFTPLPPPAPARRWTPTTWEQRCLGATFQRFQHGALPLEQATRMAYAYRTEYRHERPPCEAIVHRGALAGTWVPAVISWRLLISTPSTVEEL